MFFLLLFLTNILCLCLRYAALCIISFVDFWFICLSSSLLKRVASILQGGNTQLFIPLVHMSEFLTFKNSHEYFTRGNSQLLILWMRFSQQNLVSGSFLFRLKYPFIIFSFISACSMVSASSIRKYV